MKSTISTKILLITIALLAFITACSGEEKETPETSSPPEHTSLTIDYCNNSSTDLCLEGFGEEGEENLLILLKAKNIDFRNIYINAEKDGAEIQFTCASSADFPENIYCSGDTVPNGEDIQLKIYTKENKKLVAEGTFTIQYGNIQGTGDVEYNETESKSSELNYPNYPNYPNSSYENPTSTP